MNIRSRANCYLLLVLGLLVYSFICGNCNRTKQSIHDLIQIQTDEIFDSLVIIRRDIHQNPELSFNEVRTSKLVADYLSRLGLEVHTNIGGYGVVGIFYGKNGGKTIGWRAEMDALYTDLPDVVEFRSKVDSVRHICGHDVHTTIGLGIANVLTSLKDSIKGTVVFVFQPAEEIFAGAKSMIDDGLYEIIKPDEIYCLHLSDFPSGKVSIKSNAVFAYLNNISVTYKNQNNKELVETFTDSLFKSYSTLSNDDWDNIYDKEIGVFNENSDFKDFISYCGGYGCFEVNKEIEIKTCYFGTDKRILESLPDRLTIAINQSVYANQLVSVTGIEYPTNMVFGLNNDPELTEKVRNTITRLYGYNIIEPMYGVVVGFGDDFAYFQQDIPGGYYLLGGSNYDLGIISRPHTPDFAVDEKCIAAGINYFSSLIVERLKDQ